MEKLVSSFTIKSDKGEVFTVYEYVAIISTASFDDPHGTIEGLRRLQTTNGFPVNRLSESEFEILGDANDPIRARRS